MILNIWSERKQTGPVIKVLSFTGKNTEAWQSLGHVFLSEIRAHWWHGARSQGFLCWHDIGHQMGTCNPRAQHCAQSLLRESLGYRLLRKLNERQKPRTGGFPCVTLELLLLHLSFEHFHLCLMVHLIRILFINGYWQVRHYFSLP